MKPSIPTWISAASRIPVRAGLSGAAHGQQGLFLRYRRHLHRLFQRALHGPPQRARRKYIDSNRYDLLIYLTPDVRWVPDGQRLNGDEDRRRMLERPPGGTCTWRMVLKTRWWWSAGTIHSGWRTLSGWWTSFWAVRSIGQGDSGHFGEYLPKFKKIMPHDYRRMMNTIVQMEEKGLSSEQAQIEAFYANISQ